jgi:hypothetical protein
MVCLISLIFSNCFFESKPKERMSRLGFKCECVACKEPWKYRPIGSYGTPSPQQQVEVNFLHSQEKTIAIVRKYFGLLKKNAHKHPSFETVFPQYVLIYQLSILATMTMVSEP